MNWFMYGAASGKRKRAMPSPPPLEVPKAILNRGTSVGERMVKKYDILSVVMIIDERLLDGYSTILITKCAVIT